MGSCLIVSVVQVSSAMASAEQCPAFTPFGLVELSCLIGNLMYYEKYLGFHRHLKNNLMTVKLYEKLDLTTIQEPAYIAIAIAFAIIAILIGIHHLLLAIAVSHKSIFF